MATAIASGRVDITVKAQADRHIKAAGTTAGDLIRSLWEYIARTGDVPAYEAHQEQNSSAFENLMALRESMVFQGTDEEHQAFINMTDEDLHDMLGDPERYA